MEVLWGEKQSDVFEIWNRDVEEILQFFGNAQELDNTLCLLAEMSVQPERFASVHLGHFKIMFWPGIQCRKRDVGEIAHRAH